jgi:hypothetical protein
MRQYQVTFHPKPHLFHITAENAKEAEEKAANLLTDGMLRQFEDIEVKEVITATRQQEFLTKQEQDDFIHTHDTGHYN